NLGFPPPSGIPESASSWRSSRQYQTKYCVTRNTERFRSTSGLLLMCFGAVERGTYDPSRSVFNRRERKSMELCYPFPRRNYASSGCWPRGAILSHWYSVDYGANG